MNPTLRAVERAKRPVFAAGVALAVLAGAVAVRRNGSEDLFVYRAAAGLASRGVSPYDTAALRGEVARQFPDAGEFADNCGFFLTPQAVALFTPLALVPWPVARVVWGVLSFAALLAGLWRLPVPADRRWWGTVLAAAVLADPLTAGVASLGQTTTLMAGLLLLGYAAITRGRPALGALAWSVLFVKPHLALPLLPLAFALGGRRCGLTLTAAVAAGNLLGLTLSPDPLHLPAEYLRHLAGGHTLVKYNSVEFNPLLTSWNAALLAAGGPAIEVGIAGVLSGYAVLLAVVLARSRRDGADGVWLLAVGVAAAPVACQVLGYELLLLVGVMPLVAARWPGTPWWRLAVLAGCWALKSAPIETANALADAVGPGRLGTLTLAYRSFAALGILAIVVTLPPKARWDGSHRGVVA